MAKSDARVPEAQQPPDQPRSSSRTGAWLRLTRPDDSPELSRRDRVLLRWEIFAVFAVSLGASGVSAFVSLIGSLTAHHSLSSQSVTLNGSQAPGRPLLDLFLQLVSVTSGLAPVVLAFYLLARADDTKSIGVDRTQPGRDLLRGAGLAALIGGSGLGLYFIAYKLGFALNVVAENEPDVWWRFPVLLYSALQNGLLEEVLVTGYLLTRLRRLGVNPAAAIAISATLRGSYHLYQGFGGFLGNAAMGVIFGTLFLRWRRATPMIIAHTLIDAVAFIGYALLVGHVSWLVLARRPAPFLSRAPVPPGSRHPPLAARPLPRRTKMHWLLSFHTSIKR